MLYAPFGPTLGWQWANGTYTVREYDTDGQLITIDSAGVSTYTYNADDTIKSRSDDAPAPDTSGVGSVAVSVSQDSNRLTSVTAVQSGVTRAYSYDAAGNTTNDGLHTFTYNQAGRMSASLVGSAPTQYAYNALGQRVKKTGAAGTFYFVYDEAGTFSANTMLPARSSKKSCGSAISRSPRCARAPAAALASSTSTRTT